MKGISLKLSKRQWILLISCLVCLLAALGLHIVSNIMKGQLPHEQVAANWDADGNTGQISAYFSETEKYSLKQDLKQTEFQLESWYQQILTELKNASITLEEGQSDSARLAIYGYSATGKVQMQYNKSQAEVKAYGVGGDFFVFHPLKMLYGSYFSQSDLMQDKVILDTETAWKLFGSNDVVGMYVTINKIPHMVVGVYEKEQGYFNDAAGNKESCVYVSHQSLFNYGTYYGLESVEYLIPNPVSGFARGLVENQLKNMEVEIVEHQNRFAMLPLLEVVKQFGTRSMGLSGITFPYWENMARGYEDILAGLLITELVLEAYVLIVTIGFIWYAWLHRKWRTAQLYEKAKDYMYAARVKRHRKKQQSKGGAL